MLRCIYSSDEVVEHATFELEVVCVTGLPARTAKLSCRFFLPTDTPLRLHPDTCNLPWFRINARENSHEKLDKAALGTQPGCLRHHRGQLCAVVKPRRRRSRLSCHRPPQGERPTLNSLWRSIEGREFPLSLAAPRLSGGDQDQQCDLPASVQLPLRPSAWPHQPAQLLRGFAWHRVLYLCQGGLSGLPDDPTRQDAGRDSRRHQPARVDRKSTRLNSSHLGISYAVFCLK